MVQDGWLRNTTFGIGFYAASSQTISLIDPYMTPGFVTVDAKIGYATKKWRLALVGKNLFNRHYYIPYPYAQGRVAPGEPLTIFAVASLNADKSTASVCHPEFRQLAARATTTICRLCGGQMRIQIILQQFAPSLRPDGCRTDVTPG